MSAVRLATRYAKSLLDLAKEQNAVDLVTADMRLFDEAVKHPGLRTMLKSPIVNSDKKLAVLEAILKDKISKVTLAFITLLVKKHRELYLTEIASAYLEQLNTFQHVTRVKITTAVEADEKLINTLVEKIKKEAKLETVELTTEVDPEIIGGFIVHYEDKLFDASVSKKLSGLKKEYSSNAFVKKF